jgi:hypothetical protein
VTEIEDARYAPPNADLGRPAAARRQDAAVVVAAVAGLKSNGTRWRARLWPASGLASLTRVGPWVSSRTDRAGQQASSLGDRVRDKTSGSSGSSSPSAASEAEAEKQRETVDSWRR